MKTGAMFSAKIQGRCHESECNEVAEGLVLRLVMVGGPMRVRMGQALLAFICDQLDGPMRQSPSDASLWRVRRAIDEKRMSRNQRLMRSIVRYFTFIGVATHVAAFLWSVN